jgi:hypothetical protein
MWNVCCPASRSPRRLLVDSVSVHLNPGVWLRLGPLHRNPQARSPGGWLRRISQLTSPVRFAWTRDVEPLRRQRPPLVDGSLDALFSATKRSLGHHQLDRCGHAANSQLFHSPPRSGLSRIHPSQVFPAQGAVTGVREPWLNISVGIRFRIPPCCASNVGAFLTPKASLLPAQGKALGLFPKRPI